MGRVMILRFFVFFAACCLNLCESCCQVDVIIFLCFFLETKKKPNTQNDSVWKTDKQCMCFCPDCAGGDTPESASKEYLL